MNLDDTGTHAKAIPSRVAVADFAGRPAVMTKIKKALVTSRLTLADQNAGGDPYNSRTGEGEGAGAVWRGRSRY